MSSIITRCITKQTDQHIPVVSGPSSYMFSTDEIATRDYDNYAKQFKTTFTASCTFTISNHVFKTCPRIYEDSVRHAAECINREIYGEMYTLVSKLRVAAMNYNFDMIMKVADEMEYEMGIRR